MAGAISAVTSIAGGLLAGHSARLAGAKSENQAVNQAVAALDQDIAQIVAAVNAGAATNAQAITALQKVDSQILAYMKSQVGKPGTAWDGSGKCGKTCTAGCCVYINNLHSAIYGPNVAPYNGSNAAANGANGMIPVLQSGRGTAQIPTVYASKYGVTQRAGYTVTFNSPFVGATGPSQYAQTGIPANPSPIGRISNGTPNGSTPIFSSVSNAGLAQANAATKANNGLSTLTSVLQSSSAPGQPMSLTDKILIGVGALGALLSALLLLKK